MFERIIAKITNYFFPFTNNCVSSQIKPAGFVFFCLIQPDKLVCIFYFLNVLPNPLTTGFPLLVQIFKTVQQLLSDCNHCN